MVDPQACDFLNENFLPAYCGVEWDMHLLVREIIDPSDTVLEFGGRYGTTTCAVAVRQNNSGALIAVEPDPKVWAIQEVGMRYKMNNLLNHKIVQQADSQLCRVVCAGGCW